MTVRNNAAGADVYLQRLATLVNIDSGTRNLAGLADVADRLASWCQDAGMSTQRIPVSDDGVALGDALVARIHGHGTSRILLAGHIDTVFSPGEAQRRPFRVDGDRATGPGVSDDKGGILAGLAAIETLRARGPHTYGELILLATPDEEIGSPGSRHLLTQLAEHADVALCLECARDNGDLVHARKGVADVRIVLSGRAAHAGIEPQLGANAALAAAMLTIELQHLNDHWPDTTINVGVLRAGERPNVIADRAELLVDVRAAGPDTFNAALAAITDIAAMSQVPGVSANVTVIAPTPPWRTDPDTDTLAELARLAGKIAGVDVRFTATGGCADANLLAETGLPVLDGLGPVGGFDHSIDEWLDLSSVTPRVILLSELIVAINDSRNRADRRRAGI